MKIRLVFFVFIVFIILCKGNNDGSRFEEKSMMDTTIIFKDTIEKTKNAPLINQGKYQTVNENDEIEINGCEIEIEIKENEKYTIKIRGVEKKQGIYKVSIEEENIYINFKNIQGMYYNDTIVIQNYGNAMNKYNYFNSCDKKYIYFVRIL